MLTLVGVRFAFPIIWMTWLYLLHMQCRFGWCLILSVVSLDGDHWRLLTDNQLDSEWWLIDAQKYMHKTHKTITYPLAKLPCQLYLQVYTQLKHRNHIVFCNLLELWIMIHDSIIYDHKKKTIPMKSYGSYIIVFRLATLNSNENFTHALVLYTANVI